VSLEVLGDTATHGDDLTVVEEAKSRTSASNPVSNRARDLWKTFRNWIKGVEAGELSVEKTRFVLHVAGEFTGPIVARFSEASSPDGVRAALEAAEAELLGQADLAAKTKELVEFVFDESRRQTVEAIVLRFTLETGSATSRDEMLEALEEKTVSPEIADKVLEQLFGWATLKVEELIARQRPAVVAQQVLMTELRAIMRRVDREIYGASFSPVPSAEDVEAEGGRNLVRQLELVDLDDEETLPALADFLRAQADRIDWSVRGIIHGASFDELEADLETAWRNHKRRIDIHARERNEVDRGKLLYAECSLHKATLQGQTPPDHFIRGSYQALSDAMDVGWHPDYRRLLGGKK